MIADLKPYPTMKDSGVEWLGKVPEHWNVAPNRAFFDEIKDRHCPNEEMLSVTIKRGVIKQTSLLENTSKKDSSNLDRSNYKLVQPGDIAYNKMRAWQGAIGVSSYRGIISPAYVVQRPRDGAEPGYFHQLFRIPSFAKEAERWSYGITSDMWSLRPEHFKLIHSCLPPLPEQAAIVRYLDHVDRRVRRLVRAKRKLIALLAEQKQAIIHRAVTRGLDPDVPLKDSGIEWLGEVPEHWEVRRLRTILSERTRNGLYKSQDHYAEGETPIVQMGEAFAFPIIERCAADRVRLTTAEKETWGLLEGDLLFARRSIVFEGSGKCSMVGELPEPHVFESSMIRVRPDRRKVGSTFLFLFFRSPFSRSQVLSITKQVTISGIDGSQLKGLTVVLPPCSEQEQIVEGIQEKWRPLDDAIGKAEREIDLLGEYHTRLTADVVTGKLDVRDAAAALPEVDPLAVDEPDALDADAEAELDDLDTIPEEAEA